MPRLIGIELCNIHNKAVCAILEEVRRWNIDISISHFDRYFSFQNIREGRVEKVMGPARVGTHNTEREGPTAIVKKYRQLVRTIKQARVEHIILSGTLPIMGNKGQGY